MRDRVQDGLGPRAVQPMSRPAPRISRVTLEASRQANMRRATRHLHFLRGLPCLACGRAPPNCAAHVRKGTDGAMAAKPSDKFGVPLCQGCHMRQHEVGELTFWAEVGVDLVDQATRLWTVSGDEKAALRILFRAQQRILTHALKRKAQGWG
jgi:hypothetical protein